MAGHGGAGVNDDGAQLSVDLPSERAILEDDIPSYVCAAVLVAEEWIEGACNAVAVSDAQKESPEPAFPDVGHHRMLVMAAGTCKTEPVM